jgi:NADPH:quinone reductase-like Zn-dependent oxidoreductase
VGAGVDVVFDPVGGQALFESLKRVAWGAQYLVIGFAAGDIPKVGSVFLGFGFCNSGSLS